MSDHSAPATPPVPPTAPPVVPPPYAAPGAPSYPAPGAMSYPAPGAMFPAPYRGPVPQAPVPAPQTPRSATLGVVALILAIVATVIASAVAAVAAVQIGEVMTAAMVASPSGGFDWANLSPARGAVLVGELSFWIGTALGVWALAQGIVGIVQRRGRGASIGAVVIAALGPIVFGIAVVTALSLGGTAALAA